MGVRSDANALCDQIRRAADAIKQDIAALDHYYSESLGLLKERTVLTKIRERLPGKKKMDDKLSKVQLSGELIENLLKKVFKIDSELDRQIQLFTDYVRN